jgi:hypothetical protein
MKGQRRDSSILIIVRSHGYNVIFIWIFTNQFECLSCCILVCFWVCYIWFIFVCLHSYFGARVVCFFVLIWNTSSYYICFWLLPKIWRLYLWFHCCSCWYAY